MAWAATNDNANQGKEAQRIQRVKTSPLPFGHWHKCVQRGESIQ